MLSVAFHSDSSAQTDRDPRTIPFGLFLRLVLLVRASLGVARSHARFSRWCSVPGGRPGVSCWQWPVGVHGRVPRGPAARVGPPVPVSAASALPGRVRLIPRAVAPAFTPLVKFFTS